MTDKQYLLAYSEFVPAITQKLRLCEINEQYGYMGAHVYKRLRRILGISGHTKLSPEFYPVKYPEVTEAAKKGLNWAEVRKFANCSRRTYYKIRNAAMSKSEIKILKLEKKLRAQNIIK